MRIDLTGSSYVYPTLNFDAQRSINLYTSRSEVGNSKAPSILCPTPGHKIFTPLPIQSIRGLHTTSDRAFAVSYNTFYEIFSDGTYVNRGTITTSTSNPVSIQDNGLQVMIVDGTATGGYIFTLGTNVFTKITAPGFEGAVTVDFLDGYFIINRPNSQKYQISDLYDGLTWDALDVANAEGSPDNLIAVVSVHRQTFLIGQTTIEVVYNSGASPFPIERVQGVFIEYGCTAAFSVQQTANTIFWIGEDKAGQNVVWMSEGYNAKRISTEAIEYYLNQYDVSTVTSYSYQELGHYFIQWNIIGAPTSIVYDVTGGEWHERARFNPVAGRFERDRANFHMYAFGKHLVSDYENGNIYEQSTDILMDDTYLIKRQRTLPYVSDDLEYLYFSRFQVDCQTGVGTVTGESYDTDPQLELDWSDDGGHTYSNPLLQSMGKIGQYYSRVTWNRSLGRSRARVWRISIIAAVKVYLIAAHTAITKGYS